MRTLGEYQSYFRVLAPSCMQYFQQLHVFLGEINQTGEKLFVVVVLAVVVFAVVIFVVVVFVMVVFLAFVFVVVTFLLVLRLRGLALAAKYKVYMERFIPKLKVSFYIPVYGQTSKHQNVTKLHNIFYLFRKLLI